MLQAFFIAWLGVIAAQASPGPNMFAVAEAALGQGRRTALMVVAGINTGMLVWATGVAIGLGALFEELPVLLTALKFLGAAYLIYLAYKGLKAAITPGGSTVRAAKSRLSDIAAWRRGFLVIMTNPKAALMWSAVATFLFGMELSNAEVLAFGPLAVASGVAIYGTYALLFSTGVATRVFQRFWRIIEAMFGVAFGALGTMLFFSGARDFRP
ncbi:LysE family translocator [Devosia nitrariae]|uniref:Amino acid transporter n=1 Tax=Devosia nitrariae TaxID=2071872 RepID=A0ABQ5W0W6_9HYPH|nr:LysE family translocator [Devosia nitrariae]GLQ53478.1 amino acid transporter [Devosia nitrariae]